MKRINVQSPFTYNMMEEMANRSIWCYFLEGKLLATKMVYKAPENSLFFLKNRNQAIRRKNNLKRILVIPYFENEESLSWSFNIICRFLEIIRSYSTYSDQPNISQDHIFKGDITFICCLYFYKKKKSSILFIYFCKNIETEEICSEM